jgi:hypothetical protein
MTAMSDILGAGIAQISASQSVVFQRYERVILPYDGFVFWVRADLVNSNCGALSMRVDGSLHISVDQQMRSTENISVQGVIFTTMHEVSSLAEIDDKTLWIGTIDGTRFSFTKRGKFIASAGVYHYYGDAIYPIMESQVIDDLSKIPTKRIMSNGIPFFLSAFALGYTGTAPIYPSHLSPTNIAPPYVSVSSNNTRSVLNTYHVNQNGDIDNLVFETIVVTIYGNGNDEAFKFLHGMRDYRVDTEAFGVLNNPTIVDAFKPQSDLNVIAQKKTITFEINYRQSALAIENRKIISECIANISVNMSPGAYGDAITSDDTVSTSRLIDYLNNE